MPFGARHSQHPAVQLPAHDQPEGLLGELHAVEGGRRAAAHARGLPGHLVAPAGGVFDLEEERGGVTRSPVGRLCSPPRSSLRPPEVGSSPSTATRRVSLGAAQPPWARVSSTESGGRSPAAGCQGKHGTTSTSEFQTSNIFLLLLFLAKYVSDVAWDVR